MAQLPPIPQRQGVKTRQIYYREDAGAPGIDPASPVGYVLPLADEAGFGTSQGLIRAPVYKGTRKPDGVISGNIIAEGENPYGLETRIFPRILKDFVGPGGYVRPGGGTTALHRYFIPTSADSEMGSYQLQDESLETPKQIIRNKGIRPSPINLSYADEGVARYSVGNMGIGLEVRTDLGGTVNDFPYKAMSYFNGNAKINGVGLVGMTDFSLTLDGGVSRQNGAFREGLAASINYGIINATGRLALMMAKSGTGVETNLAYYDLAVNQTPVAIECMWANAPLELATSWIRAIFTVRFSRRGFRPGGTAGRVITQDWQMVDDETADYPAEKFGTVLGPYNLTGANNILGVKINGGATIPITLDTGAAVTVDAIVSDLNANGTFGPLATALNFNNRVMIGTDGKGSAFSVQIDTAQANSAHTALGFDGVAFTGFSDTPMLWEVYEPLQTADF